MIFSEEDEIDEVLAVDKEYSDAFQDDYIIPTRGYQVFVLQPGLRNALPILICKLSEDCKPCG